MTHKRFATVALAAAMLTGAAPALAGNGSATAQQVERLGPKHLLAAGGAQTRAVSPAPKIILITGRTLEVEELGPKLLLH